MAEGPEKALLAAFVATSVLFAARKYTQAIKDDIGDKSVFQCVHFLSLQHQACHICEHIGAVAGKGSCWQRVDTSSKASMTCWTSFPSHSARYSCNRLCLRRR